MSAPTPAPEGDGPFFTIHVHALDMHARSVRTPTGGPQLTVQSTPAGLLRLMSKVRKTTVAALMTFLHHGEVTVIDHTVRVEVEGWGRDWLKDHGFTAHQAQAAIAELREAGWIRTEQLRRPGGYLGRQIGVLAGSVYGSGDVYLAPERKNPLPRTYEGKPLSDTAEPALDGKPFNRPTPPEQIAGLSALDGETFNRDHPGTAVRKTPLEDITISGETFPPTVSVSSLQYLQSLTRTSPIDHKHLYAAITGCSPAITAHPHRASRLLTGFLSAYKADYYTPIAELLALSPSNHTARDIADYLVCVLMDPDTATRSIPLLASAADIHIKNPDDAFLPARWFLAVATACTSNVKNIPAFMHAAMYREEWKLSPTVNSLLTTLIAITTDTTISNEPHLDPHVSAHTDQILKVLADHFDAPDAQVAIWRVNARLRGQAIARFTIENAGMTPEEYLTHALHSHHTKTTDIDADIDADVNVDIDAD